MSRSTPPTTKRDGTPIPPRRNSAPQPVVAQPAAEAAPVAAKKSIKFAKPL